MRSVTFHSLRSSGNFPPIRYGVAFGFFERVFPNPGPVEHSGRLMRVFYELGERYPTDMSDGRTAPHMILAA